MDFYKIRENISAKGSIEIYPDFEIKKSKDIMVRGKSFYAIWDEEAQLWSTEESDVQRLVDEDLWNYRKKRYGDSEASINVKTLMDFSTKSWKLYKDYIQHMFDNYHQLDNKLTFSNTKTKKNDYVSRRLPYALGDGPIDAYNEIIGTLYSEKEREKIEWAIGSIVAGDAKDIQKFLVFFGEAGTGKSTILNIIQMLFEGYYTTFEAKALTSSSNAFSTEVFKSNPLVAIQHDGDLSRIEDNTKLNSIISHEEMVMNEKYKSSYSSRLNCFLFMATNRPVKITDAKSGIIRRLIDVRPTGHKIPPSRFFQLMDQVKFELGAIAKHCLDIYRQLGKNYYSDYRPTDMIMQTDVFYNFVDTYFDEFEREDGVTLKSAYEMYKQYCDASLVEFKLPQYKFREELKNYFNHFDDRLRIDGKQVRSYYSGFQKEKFSIVPEGLKDIHEDDKPYWLSFDKTESLFDTLAAEYPAQLASEKGTPKLSWKNVNTKLKDISTKELHYVKVPINHIVIDFDRKDIDGKKSFELNLKAANDWPATYAELSKSGAGIHLHYIYNGDPEKLSRVYSDDIEIKVFNGNSSLRRKLTRCNDIPIATLSSGLPLKEEKKMVNFESVKNDEKLHELIKRALMKDIEPKHTKPLVDFICKITDEAYESGIHYDISDMKKSIMEFANNSTNNKQYCMSRVLKIHYHSEDISESKEEYENDKLVFFDVEVFPNLFLVNWKFAGEDICHRMINPTSTEIEWLIKYKLVGFNCKRYDNHILYARLIGYTNYQLFVLSQELIENHSDNATFREANKLSYTDVYDFCSKKQSLKKWEIELGEHHQELGFKWDEPVPEDQWEKVAEYCDNDVFATEAVFNARHEDWVARQILADIAGMTVNDSTNALTTKIIFGDNRNPQDQFFYRDLSKPVTYLPQEAIDLLKSWGAQIPFDDKSLLPYFPGYECKNGVSTYRGEVVGEGGYVYAETGMEGDIALLDSASHHPTSACNELAFGLEYTPKFKDLLNVRLCIKHKDFEAAKTLFGGKLSRYLEDESEAAQLAQALKIAINSVYGLTSAKFKNPFKDPRNNDNFIAKRGALFMIDLKHAVQEEKFKVLHIKTDSIKVPDYNNHIIEFVKNFGKKYGYTFELEDIYDKICLVNDAVYIAKYKKPHKDKKTGKDIYWTATGAQFQHPYVFKYLFSKEPIEFKDMCETRTVKSALYLDMNESLPDVSLLEKEKTKLMKKGDSLTDEERKHIKELDEQIANGHNYIFVGKTGQFCPIVDGAGGGILLREQDGKFNSVSGSKGYRWLESEVVKKNGLEDKIDKRYFQDLVDEAVAAISQYGDFEWFVSDEPYLNINSDELPF